MEKPIQILHDINPSLHYDPRQLDAIKEMAYIFACKVMEEYQDKTTPKLLTRGDIKEFVEECAPGRGETYKPDDENPGLLPDEK